MPPRTFADAKTMPDRWGLALKLRARGYTLARIGARLSVTKERAGQIVRKAERRRKDLAGREFAHR